MAPQKPETFMLSSEAQQALPQDAQVALQQVDNREFPRSSFFRAILVPSSRLTDHSQILPHLRPCRLAARTIHSQVPSAHWRIRLLRSLVSRAPVACAVIPC